MKKFKEYFLQDTDDYKYISNPYNEALQSVVVAAFGRFNPPSVGHLKLMEKVLKEARNRGGEARIYASHSLDPAKNPLEYTNKIKYLKNMAPNGVNVINSPVNNPFNLTEELAKDGFKHIILIAGSDRIAEYERAGKYAYGHGAEKFEVISAGDRDPDATGVKGMSASKLRALVADGNRAEFIKGVPFDKTTANHLFDDVAKGMK